MKLFSALLLALLIGGCTTQRTIDAAANLAAQQGTPPIVRTTNSGTASLTVIACPVTPTGTSTLTDYLQTLSAQSPIVTATTGGTSRLVLNICPNPLNPEVVRAAAASRRS